MHFSFRQAIQKQALNKLFLCAFFSCLLWFIYLTVHTNILLWHAVCLYSPFRLLEESAVKLSNFTMNSYFNTYTRKSHLPVYICWCLSDQWCSFSNTESRWNQQVGIEWTCDVVQLWWLKRAAAGSIHLIWLEANLHGSNKSPRDHNISSSWKLIWGFQKPENTLTLYPLDYLRLYIPAWS